MPQAFSVYRGCRDVAQDSPLAHGVTKPQMSIGPTLGSPSLCPKEFSQTQDGAFLFQENVKFTNFISCAMPAFILVWCFN